MSKPVERMSLLRWIWLWWILPFVLLAIGGLLWRLGAAVWHNIGVVSVYAGFFLFIALVVVTLNKLDKKL